MKLISAIWQVLGGESPLEPGLAAKLLRRLVDEAPSPALEPEKREHTPMPPVKLLTPRELEVLSLMAQGRTNPEIGEILVISPGTVKRHVENIIAKLNVSDRTQAVVRAYELGILSLPGR